MRRGLLFAPLALAACGPHAAAGPPQTATPLPLPPLKSLAPFPLGVEITQTEANDPEGALLASRNFSQITPGLELKMEAILGADGGLDFRRPDALLQFAEGRDLRVHGHVLVWYTDRPPSFVRLLSDRPAFETAYDAYVRAVAGRYRGRVRGWDVVNEAVEDDGGALRACLWSEVFGEGYIERAFHIARDADPDAPLFLNDYGLESHPLKRRRFLALAETLLKRGAPLGGLGTQLHMDWTQAPADVDVMMNDLAALGLPIHVSELDVSTKSYARTRLTSLGDRLTAQAHLVGGAAQAFMRLPQRQRYAFTAWGLRDKDSWLRLSPGFGDPDEAPTLFDDEGRPKASARALAAVLRTGMTS